MRTDSLLHPHHCTVFVLSILTAEAATKRVHTCCCSGPLSCCCLPSSCFLLFHCWHNFCSCCFRCFCIFFQSTICCLCCLFRRSDSFSSRSAECSLQSSSRLQKQDGSDMTADTGLYSVCYRQQQAAPWQQPCASDLLYSWVLGNCCLTATHVLPDSPHTSVSCIPMH